MTAKEYLRHIRDLNSRIEILTDDINEARSKLTSMQSPSPEDDLVCHSTNSDNIASGVARLVDLEAEWADAIDEWVDLRKDTGMRLRNLKDSRYSRLLHLYYLSGKTWEEVAVALGYTWRNTYYLHGKALMAFERENSDLFIKFQGPRMI